MGGEASVYLDKNERFIRNAQMTCDYCRHYIFKARKEFPWVYCEFKKKWFPEKIMPGEHTCEGWE